MLTAGESHGKALVAVLEGLPAGVPVSTEELAHQLARRRHGHGRGGRQKFESDRFEILTGVRHGRTMGSPIAVTIPNLEFEQKYAELMGVEGEMDPAKRLTRPRPGPCRPGGRRRSTGSTTCATCWSAPARARPPPGSPWARSAESFLGELDVALLSHVVQIGTVKISSAGNCRRPTISPRSTGRRCDASIPTPPKRMVAEIDRLRKERDTIGGVFEVLAYGAPPGLGSYVHYDRKLDARLALALMSIQSVKGVEVGDGFATAAKPGSKAHDEIVPAHGAAHARHRRARGASKAA